MAERSVNKAILVGRIGCDAETRYTQGGTPVSRFSLAMNRQWRDSERQVHEGTDWIYAVLWKNENLCLIFDQRGQTIRRRTHTNSVVRRQRGSEAIRHRSNSR
jgi:single stranded DNA-binding protein